MNKLFTKIAALALGATMATGVGVAVASNTSNAKAANATSYNWQKVTSTSEFVDGTEILVTQGSYYLNVSATSTSQTPRLASLTLSSDLPTLTPNNTECFLVSGSGSSIKLCKATDTSKWLITGSSNNAARINTGTTGQYWSISSAGTNEFYLRSNSGSRYLSRYSTTDFRSYTNSNTNANLVLYKLVEAKTLSSISVSGYTTEFTVGDTFSFGGTVTAHYSDSTTGNVTASTTFSGYNMSVAGNYTVTASYTEGGVTKTATYGITVSAPTTPTLSLDKASFSGYTGQSVSVTATFANLESDLAWSASGTGSISGGSITWSSSDHRNGTSTYTATLSGAGEKTIVADATGVDAEQCVVTITQTTVDITKASTSIPVGRSETLAATHNASSVGILNWTSSNDSVATVDASGKVTIASGATVGTTVTITATSSVDTSVSDTCTVTVDEAPLDTTYDFVTNFSSYNDGWTNSYAEHTGINGKTQVGGDYAATIDLYHASKQGNTITDRPVFASKTGSGSWAKVIGFTLNESNYKIGDVSVTFSQWTTKTPDIALFSGDSATGTPLDSGTVGTKNTISTTGLNAKTFTVGYCDKNTGSNVQAGLTSIYITLVKENALDHVTVSFASDPADRTFTAGSNFAFNGTLTASYTVDSPKAVTPSGYFIEGEEGTGDPITTSTLLTVDDHNGADIYVQYKEGGITKYDSFTLIVNPAPATSVTLSSSSDSVALEEVFEVSSITATVNPSAYATQGVTWEVYDSDGLVEDVTYVFDGSEFYATEEADVVFHVKANSNPSIYAEFTLTITGNPIAHLLDGELVDVTDGSASVFGDAGTLTYGVTTENFEGTMSYTWTTSNSSVISIDDDQGDTCDFYVEGIAGSARLSCRVQGSTKGDVTVYIDVTVTAVTVTSVTWNAPTIKVYSGATLSTTGWNVRYSTNSGKTDVQADSFDILLGGSVVSSGYAFAAADDGKALTVRVGNTVSETSTTVSVTQTLRPVWAPVPGETSTSSLVFEAACGGSGTADDGKSWTVTSDGTESTYDPAKGIHYGTGSAAVQYIKLTSSDFSVGNITRVVVNASTASGVSATAGVKINGVQFGGEPQSLSSSAAEYTFTGEVAASTIEVEITKPSSAAKAIYCKSIVVTYATPSGEDVNIANISGHEAAQKTVVKFAKAFNAALGATQNCTTGLSSAWATAESAWSTFLSEAEALGTAEEAYAKNLIKYATAQWTENTDDNYEYCLERCLATYEKCVTTHSQEKFMEAVRPVSGRAPVSPIAIATSENINMIAVVAIVSIISVTAIGGYFFLRKRKETN